MQITLEKITKSPTVIFVIFGLIFGFAMLFLTPLNGVPDEPAHFHRAKEVSQGILYNNPSKTTNFHGATGYSPIMYAFSGLSVKITENCDENIQYYAGRIANLIIWIILTALAIHITPIFKWAFFVTALFPMSVYEGMSLSADSFSNAFSFLFFAYMLKLMFNNKEFSYKKDIPLLFIFAFIGAMCKGVYFPLFLLPFVPIKKHKVLICITIITFSLTIGYLWSANNYIALGKNVDYYYNKSLIIQHPIEHLNRIFETLLTRKKIWFEQLICCLGWLTLYMPKTFYNIETIMFLSSIILIPHKFNIKPVHRLWSFLLCIIYLITVSSLLFCIYTPVNNEYIAGIQGRYFLAIIPLIFLIVAINKTNINKKYSTIIKLFICFCCAYILWYTCYYIIYENLPYANIMFRI